MTSHTSPQRWPAVLVACFVVLLVLLAALTGCNRSSQNAGSPLPTELFVVNTSPDQQRIRAEAVRDLARAVPQQVREGGTLVVGMTGNYPPLSFRADDAMTMIGIEPDLAQLIADVLDLKLELIITDWLDVFAGVTDGRFHIGLGNVAVTPERLNRFDMIAYQQENQAFAVLAGSPIESLQHPGDIAGLRIGVGAHTKSEEILEDWNDSLRNAGLEPAELKNFAETWEYQAALEAGEIDATFGPMSILNFEAVTKGRSRVVGQVPGDGVRPALVSAIVKKDAALGPLVRDAIDTVIVTGKYQAIFERWALQHAMLPSSTLHGSELN
ncbi:transporter substrate-binding domain-containing protein [Hoyosella sp. G463]|uniref:Transporter substrate-binding domain-containing protein n=1 Tax=Lolliginicoccus lacisalsi TaxID=2742202 RepID=A0A927JDQ8_9ACTN|nr:transporter substrate-binding domain-containing protein [Lolliginicoccus lacisalsi]MBD8507280.1 transporter substrate-binding domain-containing protein [Lolliginicoccus lacisalsi]